MSITLADLLARLESDVPARSGVPTETQYTSLLEDAVADFSRRVPLERVHTLEVTSGVADYTLPADFLRVIRMENLTWPSGVMHAAGGLVPVARDYTETWTVNGLTLSFLPTPAYTTTRYLRYAAAHVLDDDNAYPYLTAVDTPIVLLKAAELALRLQARAAAIAGEMAEYQIGDERVKRQPASDSLAEAAALAAADYEAAIAKRIGTVGMRTHYDALGR